MFLLASPQRIPDFCRRLLQGLLVASIGWTAPGTSRAEAPPAKPTLDSLQREVDELRSGQKRLLEELSELRRQLREGPGRSEVAAQPEPPAFFTLNVQGEPFRGGTNARVAVVAFSDFNCSFCARFEKEIYPKIDERYVRSGRIRYLFRDLPDRADADSITKAEAARCAGEQGKFWEMHDQLFADPLPFADETARRHIRTLGIGGADFQACLESHRYLEPIRRSSAMAGRMGIHGTPAFLVGTLDATGNVIRSVRIFTGAESFETFRALLDDLLEPAEKAAK